MYTLHDKNGKWDVYRRSEIILTNPNFSVS